MLKQSQPRCLGDVGGVALHQLEIGGDGPDQPGELINQAFLCLMIPLAGLPHQARHILRAELLLKYRH